MKNEMTGVEIRRGDTVEIVCAGVKRRGVVIHVHCNAIGEPRWAIEYTLEDGRYGGYWKQAADGGTVKVIKRAKQVQA